MPFLFFTKPQGDHSLETLYPKSNRSDNLIEPIASSKPIEKMQQYRELEIPLAELNGTTLDLSRMVANRFRFLVIDSLINDQVLEIISLSTMPKTEHYFATISYPWQGLSPLETPSLGQFSVQGAESGGMISANVLMTCARVARLSDKEKCRCDLLWMDRLCIKQQDKEDKNWQIRHMFDIYKSCAVCLVLPGGLGRLINLSERSTWAQRAWTLQEAIVPPVVSVVIEWKLPDFCGYGNCDPVTVLEPFHSGIFSLKGLIMAVRTGWKMTFKLPHPGDPGYVVMQEELSRLRGLECLHYRERLVPEPELETPGDSSDEVDIESQESLTENELNSEKGWSETDIEDQGDSPQDAQAESQRSPSNEPDDDEASMYDQSEVCSEVSSIYESEPLSPLNDSSSDLKLELDLSFRTQIITAQQAYLLWLVMEASDPTHSDEPDIDLLHVALWKATWIRSSSRPVDMVFSIMGLFGVSLDPGKFHHDDRAGATLALASSALQQGRKANWLGAYLNLDPCPKMSSFPLFPNTSESGSCTVQSAAGLMNVEDLVDETDVIAVIPSSTLDSQGYLHLESQGYPLDWSEGRPNLSEKHIPAQNGAWVLKRLHQGPGRYYAVKIGYKRYLRPGPEALAESLSSIVLIVVERHSRDPDRFHRISHANVDKEFTADWGKYEFAIGGPNNQGSSA